MKFSNKRNKAAFSYIKFRIAKIERHNRKRKNKIYKPFQNKNFLACHKAGLKQKVSARTETSKYLDSKGFFEEFLVDSTIKIPKVFSLQDNYYESLKCLKAIYSSLHEKSDRVIFDFYDCQEVALSSLFLLKALTSDLRTQERTVQERFNHNFAKFPNFFIVKSKHDKVNALLYTSGITQTEKALADHPELRPVSVLPFFIGGRNRLPYTENTKGKACRITINFINKALRSKGVELTNEGWNYHDALISEILNNAEDHNLLKEWYLMGTLFDETHKKDDVIGQLDLVFLNFGYSIYEGLVSNKEENIAKFEELTQMYSYVTETKSASQLANFTKENFFTLFALQEGVSRLSFEEESRGTGTVKFIKAFMELGSFVDKKLGYKPKLTIISGKTMVVCDNETKPFTSAENGKTYLTLNKENDFLVLPSTKHLKNLRENFPGTLFSIRIYLSTKYFKKIVGNNGNQKD